MMHMHTLGESLVTAIQDLIDTIATEQPGNSQVSRDWTKFHVDFRKRRAQRESRMRIGEGITLFPSKPMLASGTNERDDVGYVFVLSIVQGSSTEIVNEDWRLGIFEQAIRQRFNWKRLGVTLDSGCELYCRVEPGELPDWADLEDGLDASFLKITCFVRESRRG